MTPSNDTTPHRLFAAIVLMGSGLAVGCGGVAEGHADVAGAPGTSGSNATDASGTGGRGGTGGGSGSGPMIDVTIGGTPGQQPTVTPGPFNCPTEQWSCASNTCGDVEQGWALPSECACEPSRPRSAKDCAADEAFVCQRVTSNAQGDRLSQPLALSCNCVTKTEFFCSQECDLAYGVSSSSCVASDDERSALCNCAVVFLK